MTIKNKYKKPNKKIYKFTFNSPLFIFFLFYYLKKNKKRQKNKKSINVTKI